MVDGEGGTNIGEAIGGGAGTHVLGDGSAGNWPPGCKDGDKDITRRLAGRGSTLGASRDARSSLRAPRLRKRDASPERRRSERTMESSASASWTVPSGVGDDWRGITDEEYGLGDDGGGLLGAWEGERGRSDLY